MRASCSRRAPTCTARPNACQLTRMRRCVPPTSMPQRRSPDRAGCHAFPPKNRVVAPRRARGLAPRYARPLAFGFHPAGSTSLNIVFGTDGWRARIADEYTFDAVRVCAQSVAEWVVKNGGADRGVVIGFDRRFASEHFAAAAAEVVAAHDVNVHLANAAAPTQSFSCASMR